MTKMKLKKGDTVIVVSGKDKGKTGTVSRAFPKKDQLIVEGVAVVKRHTKAKGGQSGRILEKEAPIHVSNVMLLDPKEKKQTRVTRKVEGGKRVRIAKKSGATLA